MSLIIPNSTLLIRHYLTKSRYFAARKKKLILYVEVLKELDTSPFDVDGNVCLSVVCACAGIESS